MSDLISREAAIERIDEALARVFKEPCGELILRKVPSAQPERKTGKWLPDIMSAYEMRFVCSCCKEPVLVPTIMYKPMWSFCPNCGADMREDEQE